MTRVCSNCDKTTSQSQSKTEKSVIFITNLQSLHYRQQQGPSRAIASQLDGIIILFTEHWHSWVISFIFDIRTALESRFKWELEESTASLSMETVK